VAMRPIAGVVDGGAVGAWQVARERRAHASSR
jgi:hypothetical protein